MHDLATIWREVSVWPPDLRQALAARLLQSLEQDKEPSRVPKPRQEALQQLIGIWKTEEPPSSEQVTRLVHEQRMKKYG